MFSYIKNINLAAFDGEKIVAPPLGQPNVQTTLLDGLSPENKTYYDTALIHAAEPKLVHAQFGQKRPIPSGKGKTIEFRKFDQLPVMVTPLVEGVTPDGQSITVTADTATVSQYGGYVTLSDVLEMTALDPMLTETVKAIGSQAGRSLDRIVREILVAGGNVQYAEGQVDSRSSLTKDHKLTVKAIRMAVRTLKNANADTIDGGFVGIIHPDIAFDLMSDPEWRAPHEYKDTQNLYENEIGMVAGVRFVETTEAKVFDGGVYATLIFAANAYGTTEISGGGLQTIIKQKGSAGSADPLDQRSTVGWKATLTAKIISDEYMVRIETKSTFSA